MNIAVLMTTYNGEKYLEAQLDSIIAQKVNADVALIVRADRMTNEERSAMGHLAQKRIQEAYSWEFIAKEYQVLWQNAGE